MIIINYYRAETDVSSWDSEKRLEYSTEFCEDSNLSALAATFYINENDASVDFVEKFNRFLDVDDVALTKILTLQHVLQADLREGGQLMTKIRDSNPVALQVLQAFQKMTYGVTAAAGRGVQMQQHGHQHGPNCQHGAPKAPPAHDVTSGIAEKIER